MADNADCLFCRIVRGEVPAKVVYEDDAVVAFADLNPQAPTHVLVVPREHIPDVTQFGAYPPEVIGAVMQGVAAAADQVRAPGGFRAVANVGPDSGQSVMHLHFHVLSGRRLAWPPG